MRAGAGTILGIAAILIATAAWAGGRYDPKYAVCMEAYGSDGTRLECFFDTMEQCKMSASGSSGTCFNNPGYIAPPPEPAAVTEPAPPPVKPAKSSKSAKTAKLPSQQPAQPQQR